MALPGAATDAESILSPSQAHDPEPAPQPAGQVVERAARAIERAGLSGIAPTVLRALKPAAWLGGQMLWVFQPFTGSATRMQRRPGTLDPGGLSGMAALLEEDGGVDALIRRLESSGAGKAER